MTARQLIFRLLARQSFLSVSDVSLFRYLIQNLVRRDSEMGVFLLEWYHLGGGTPGQGAIFEKCSHSCNPIPVMGLVQSYCIPPTDCFNNYQKPIGKALGECHFKGLTI